MSDALTQAIKYAEAKCDGEAWTLEVHTADGKYTEVNVSGSGRESWLFGSIHEQDSDGLPTPVFFNLAHVTHVKVLW